MDDFITLLKKFRAKNGFDIIKAVVLVGFFNDLLEVTDLDLGPDFYGSMKNSS